MSMVPSGGHVHDLRAVLGRLSCRVYNSAGKWKLHLDKTEESGGGGDVRSNKFDKNGQCARSGV